MPEEKDTQPPDETVLGGEAGVPDTAGSAAGGATEETDKGTEAEAHPS